MSHLRKSKASIDKHTTNGPICHLNIPHFYISVRGISQFIHHRGCVGDEYPDNAGVNV